MRFPFFQRKKYNVSTLPDISRINLPLFFREFESIFLLKMSELDIANSEQSKNRRVNDVINHTKEFALASVKEAIELAYRPK